MVLSGEGTLVLAYYVIDHEDEQVAMIHFHICYASMFGPPNDEALLGHPLYGRGLQSYSAYLVEGSSWIRSLEKMNSVHPYHRAEAFARRKHFIWTFHDSTFECVADGYEIFLKQGSIASLIPEMARLLTKG